MKAFFLVLSAAAVLVGTSGCSLLNRGPRFVTVNVTPSDATVIVNGVEYRRGAPQIVEVDPSRQLIVTAYKLGYKNAACAVDSQLSTVGTIDAVSSFWIIPFFGLFSSGAWELKETNVVLTLEPLPAVQSTAESDSTIPDVIEPPPAADSAADKVVPAVENGDKIDHTDGATDAPAASEMAGTETEVAAAAVEVTESPEGEAVESVPAPEDATEEAGADAGETEPDGEAGQ